jgi:hypothetical protein
VVVGIQLAVLLKLFAALMVLIIWNFGSVLVRCSLCMINVKNNNKIR